MPESHKIHLPFVARGLFRITQDKPLKQKGFSHYEIFRNVCKMEKSDWIFVYMVIKSCKVYQAFCGSNDAMIKSQSIPKLLRVKGVKGFKRGQKEDFNLYKR